MEPLIFKQNNPACHLCHAPAIEFVDQYRLLNRITSDCKVWGPGGEIALCGICGTVQKPVDAAWLIDVDKIYKDYLVYQQSDGVEQATFDADTGQLQRRSAYLIKQLFSNFNLPCNGRVLDVGSGNGAVLKSFSEYAELWNLVGLELNDKYKIDVESIARVEKLYTCELEYVPGNFDVVTMIHSLEHIPSPKNFLISIKNKLKKNGLLFIQVPNYIHNPFDLLVTDHCTHFSDGSIKKLLCSSGYDVVFISDNWIPGELTVVGKKTLNLLSDEFCVEDFNYQILSDRIAWLFSVRQLANNISTDYKLGIFGTSIAGTWLFSELTKSPAHFFVDEDSSRIGRVYFERHIYHPRQIKETDTVFMPFFSISADKIKKRMANFGYQFKMIFPQPLIWKTDD